MKRIGIVAGLLASFVVGIAVGLAAMAGGWLEWSRGVSADWGRFPRPPVAELLANGRQLRLLEDFAYVDPHGTVWTAPKDAVVDGASIPRAFWTFTGGPLEGKYRNASIVHDVACDRRALPSDKVHQMFYEACRCGGVPENEAKLLYAAVYHFGPHWEISETEAPVVVQAAKGKTRQMKIRRRDSEVIDRPLPTAEDRDELEQFVRGKQRSLDDLRHWRRKDRPSPQGHRLPQPPPSRPAKQGQQRAVGQKIAGPELLRPNRVAAVGLEPTTRGL